MSRLVTFTAMLLTWVGLGILLLAWELDAAVPVAA